MASILDRPISQWAGMEYSCACGKSHKVDIQAIRVGSGVIQELPGILRDLGASHIFLVADNYTYEAAGRQVEQLLDQAGLAYHKRVFQTETPLVPNRVRPGLCAGRHDQPGRHAAGGGLRHTQRRDQVCQRPHRHSLCHRRHRALHGRLRLHGGAHHFRRL